LLGQKLALARQRSRDVSRHGGQARRQTPNCRRKALEWLGLIAGSLRRQHFRATRVHSPRTPENVGVSARFSSERRDVSADLAVRAS
jgi:hypothetical protein